MVFNRRDHRRPKSNSDPDDDRSATSTGTRKRLFPRIFSKNRNKTTTIDHQQQANERPSSTNGAKVTDSPVRGKADSIRNNSFYVDSIGYDMGPKSAEMVIELERKYQNSQHSRGSEKRNNDRKPQNHNSGGSSMNGSIPLTPITEALSIDDAPIGRAADLASVAGSLVTATSSTATKSRSNNSKKNSDNDKSGSRIPPRPNTTITKISDQKKTKPKVSIVSYCLNYLCHTQYFHNLCNTIFDLIDEDKSGYIDQNELYQGMLLIHLKLGCHAGPAACKPIPKQRCQTIFIDMDHDKSGLLDREEFYDVMILLFGHVFIRVIVQWMLTIVLVPMMSNYFLSNIVDFYHQLMQMLIDSPQYAILHDTIALTTLYEDMIHIHETYLQVYYYQLCQYFQQNALPQIPLSIQIYTIKIYEIVITTIHGIPDEIWYTTVPLTIISSILGLMVVPYCIFKVDDFFSWLGSLLKGNSIRKNKNINNNKHNNNKRQGPPVVAARSKR